MAQPAPRRSFALPFGWGFGAILIFIALVITIILWVTHQIDNPLALILVLIELGILVP